MNAAAMPQPSHQRSRGRLELDYHLHEGRTVLGGLYQSPPMRALFPDPEADEAPICALVNTAGGLAGGDRVEIALSLGAGARASFSTPAAEKITFYIEGEGKPKPKPRRPKHEHKRRRCPD